MKIIVQNLATEYKDEGSGPILLLLHGWQDSHRTFDEITDILKGSYRVIRLDMPGFGQTELPKKSWNLQEYVDFVAAFIKKLDIDVYTLGGHSFGGRVAIKGVFQGTFAPERLVLMDTAGFVKSASMRNRLIRGVTRVGKIVLAVPPLTMVRDTLRDKLYEGIQSDYRSAGPLRETFVNIINEDLAAAAESITTPTLLVWGENDIATPLEDGERFQKLIQGSQLEVIEDAGHFVHKEKAESVAQCIQQFL